MTIGKRYVKGWLVCYAFMLAFFLVMVPSLAYADTYVATEDSAVRAAMVYLGYDPDEGESTNKLVTAFYDATSGDEYTGWQSFVNGLYQPLDTVNYNEQWWSPADGFMFSFQVDAARSDAANIYAQWKNANAGGGSSGGGVVDGDMITFTGTLYDYTAQYKSRSVYFYSRSTTIPFGNLPNEITVTLPVAKYEEMLEEVGNSYSLFFLSFGYGSYGYDPPFLVMFENEGQISLSDNTSDYNTGVSIRYAGKYSMQYMDYATQDNNFLGNSTSVVTGTNGEYFQSFNFMYVIHGGNELPPEPEPEPEPEPPTPPEPPRDPTPPTPDPTQPSQTVDLQGIIDRLDIIIRNQAILINWLDDAFASVNQNIQWLGELIDESFGWLWEVLGNLQSSIDSGINRITTWLEMIYRKIGGQGGTVSRPNIDTPTPWDDFLAWLEGILQRLLDLIFGVTPAALQNLLSGLADLTTKFPFSIPWDLAALFALFAHDPVTPVVDIPLMVPFANAPLPIHVDCTTWDGLAAIVRDGETVLFAAWLVMATPDFYRHLNSVSGAD